LTSGLVLSTTFIAAEALAVITIMPRVARDLGGLSLYGWVFSSFMLGSLLGTVGAGRQVDAAGPVRPFLAGITLFVAGLTIAGLAPSMAVLVLGRVVQGLGAGAVPAVSYVVIGRSLPEELRPRMMAVLSTAWVVPGLIGPGLSAAVAGLLGWRWVFLGLIPLVVAAGSIALPSLRRLGGPVGASSPRHRPLDAVCVVVGSALLLGGVASRSWAVALVLVLGGLALAVPALSRLLPTGTLTARRGLPAVMLARGLLTFSFFGGDAFVTLTITNPLHHSIAVAGLAVTTATLAWTAGSWVQVHTARRWQNSTQLRCGVVLLLAGIVGMVLALRSGVGVGVAVASWTVAGLGMGLAYAPTSLMMLREAPEGREGWAAASLNLSDVLGTALGTGLAGAALVVGAHQGLSTREALTGAFAVAGAGAVLALLVSARLPRRLSGLASIL
jgi:MFS family permease